VIVIPYCIIFLIYFISYRANNQKYSEFLFGHFGRSEGFLVIVGLTLTILLAAENFLNKNKELEKCFLALIVFAILYGLVQQSNLDPLKWKVERGTIILTLGNSNFSGALLGILTGFILPRIFTKKLTTLISNLFLLILVIFLIINTNSSQGLVIFIFLFCIFMAYKLWNLVNMRTFISLIVSAFLLGFLFLITNYDYILKNLNSALQVQSRFRHFALGFRIWHENPVFGVGIDGMGLNSARYITESDAKHWGNYTFPDRSHNIFIDGFANGGILIGILIIFTYTCITWYSVKLISNKNTKRSDNNESGKEIIPYILIWYGVLLQNFFSPSHIYIKFIGFVAGGCIVAKYNKNNSKTFN
jgi:O-antigen ligase